MARPSKLTAEVQQKIVSAIRAGNYAETSARHAGISPATFYRWMERGRKAKSGLHRDFYEAVRKAEADAEVEAVALIRKRMPDDHRACMSFLERRFPSRWRRRDSHELSGPGGGPVRISDELFSDPELRKASRELLRRVGRARAGEPGGPGDRV